MIFISSLLTSKWQKLCLPYNLIVVGKGQECSVTLRESILRLLNEGTTAMTARCAPACSQALPVKPQGVWARGIEAWARSRDLWNWCCRGGGFGAFQPKDFGWVLHFHTEHMQCGAVVTWSFFQLSSANVWKQVCKPLTHCGLVTP